MSTGHRGDYGNAIMQKRGFFGRTIGGAAPDDGRARRNLRGDDRDRGGRRDR
jgi:hypothetical protein